MTTKEIKIPVNLRISKENHQFIANEYMWEIKAKSKSNALEIILNKAIDELRKNHENATT